jgi:hypothetical protein
VLGADIESIVSPKTCGHATQEMSDLYSTVAQRETEKPKRPPGKTSQAAVFLWAL